MMRRARLIFMRWLCGTNIHAAIKETRIRRDDFAVKSFRQLNGDLRFSNGGGTNDEDKGKFYSLFRHTTGSLESNSRKIEKSGKPKTFEIALSISVLVESCSICGKGKSGWFAKLS